ncbi:MAG: glycosyltransferase family 29 protein [Phaeovulum sp.]|uniref:glycosyltransferase family 29 protein n=1 Tax=Phaeovulum sp. TaxID=2934796 RepID=UPI0027305E06|nr:glycosyltransferase family 29 protein [Phaeovulum sp.]MDP2061501.1 glycosyltransferase family 29 protein [Phaeovulum sp.]
MTPLAFLLARTLRREAPLMALSVPQAALLEDLRGRTVALVGNARALATTTHGAAIDAADIVIRINRAPMPAPASHGSRTDWLALATGLPAADRDRLAGAHKLWMSPKRKRLSHAVALSPGFYLHPLPDYARLAAEIDAPPTTGLMLIELLARSRMKSLSLFGFDFFASLSLSGHRSAGQVPHDFAAEAAFVAALMARDSRITRAE